MITDLNTELSIEQVNRALSEILPALAKDGVCLELVSFDGRDLCLRVLDVRDRSPSTLYLSKLGIQQKLREVLPGFGEIRLSQAQHPWR